MNRNSYAIYQMVPFSRAELQGVQNAAARLITGTRKFDHVTPILRELHWLPVAQQIQYKIAMLVNKCLRGLAPTYLAELCRPVVHLIGRLHLRSAASGKLDVQRTATAIGRRNFAISGPEIWNSLPAELRLSTLSTATFARRLKAHLFVSTEWHVPAARLILLKVALLINIIMIIIITFLLLLLLILLWRLGGGIILDPFGLVGFIVILNLILISNHRPYLVRTDSSRVNFDDERE